MIIGAAVLKKANAEGFISVTQAAALRKVSRQAIYWLINNDKLHLIDHRGRKFLKRREVLGLDQEIGQRKAKR